MSGNMKTSDGAIFLFQLLINCPQNFVNAELRLASGATNVEFSYIQPPENELWYMTPLQTQPLLCPLELGTATGNGSRMLY